MHLNDTGNDFQRENKTVNKNDDLKAEDRYRGIIKLFIFLNKKSQE